MNRIRSNARADLIRVCMDSGCGGAELCRIGGCHTRPYAIRMMTRGERIHLASRAGMKFRIVRSGLVATCAMTLDGRRQILGLNVAGDVVCPMVAEESDSWCEALAATELCELDLAGDRDRLRADPVFGALLFRLVHDGLQRSATRILAIGRFTGLERICAFLAEMARRTGQRRGAAWHVHLPMSREDIADYLGLNTDTVSRLLTRVRKAGLVRFVSQNEYEVPRLDRLEARVPIASGTGTGDRIGSRTGMVS